MGWAGAYNKEWVGKVTTIQARGEEEGRGQYKGGVKTRRRVEDLGNRTRERFGNT